MVVLRSSQVQGYTAAAAMHAWQPVAQRHFYFLSLLLLLKITKNNNIQVPPKYISY